MDVLLEGFKFFLNDPFTILVLIFGVFFGIIFISVNGGIALEEQKGVNNPVPLTPTKRLLHR